MNRDSRRMDSNTASAVTTASSANAAIPGIRFHRACAAKNVAKRTAIAAASMAFAVTGYRRAALSSQTISNASATTTPIATRTGGWSHPASIE